MTSSLKPESGLQALCEVARRTGIPLYIDKATVSNIIDQQNKHQKLHVELGSGQG